jgi:hypothetical protein
MRPSIYPVFDKEKLKAFIPAFQKKIQISFSLSNIMLELIQFFYSFLSEYLAASSIDE